MSAFLSRLDAKGWFGFVVLVIVVLCAAFAPWIDHVVVDDVAGITNPRTEDFIGDADAETAQFDKGLRNGGAIGTVPVVETGFNVRTQCAKFSFRTGIKADRGTGQKVVCAVTVGIDPGSPTLTSEKVTDGNGRSRALAVPATVTRRPRSADASRSNEER